MIWSSSWSLLSVTVVDGRWTPRVSELERVASNVLKSKQSKCLLVL